MIRTIIFTASTGCFPTAVSAESMTASVPSKMALATSEASARVGRLCSTIDSSIWVAVMTGFPAARASRIIRFWSTGTRSGGSSTPRSPRATMMPSAAARIASRFSTAWGFSILAMTGILASRRAMNRFAASTSAASRTKEIAT